MEENKSFDMDEILDELSSQIEDIVEDAVEDKVEDLVEDAVYDVLDGMFDERVKDALENIIRDGFEFVLKDGTVVRPKERMKILSPGKSRLFVCYGGLRVEQKYKSQNHWLMVQTGPNRYDGIGRYKTREEAIEALKKVAKAMEDGMTMFEL